MSEREQMKMFGMGEARRLPTPEEVEAARTVRGGFTAATLAAWGVSWPPPKGWRRELERRRKRATGDTVTVRLARKDSDDVSV